MRISFDLDDTLICYREGVPQEPRLSWSRRLFVGQPTASPPGVCPPQNLANRGCELVDLHHLESRSGVVAPAGFGIMACAWQALSIKTSTTATSAATLRGRPPSKNPRAFGIDLHVDDSDGVKIEGEQHGFSVVVGLAGRQGLGGQGTSSGGGTAGASINELIRSGYRLGLGANNRAKEWSEHANDLAVPGGSGGGRLAGRREDCLSAPLRPVVEVEEDVYSYEPANNGAGPMWCSGSTCLVRIGDDVFASGLETLKDAKPLNNCRWTLYKRTAGGWQLQQADPEGPDPRALPAGCPGRREAPALGQSHAGGRPQAYSGPARPEILQFSATDPKAPFETILPVWDGQPQFTEHSYRSFAADGRPAR